MRPRSLRRSLADPSVGSHAGGSEGMMTRARRRRRLLAESSERLRNPVASDPTLGSAVAAGSEEWRDWSSLIPDLVEEISGRLLSLDVAEYLRFRAVCRPWRDLTADPSAAPLDSRFRPRNWALLRISPDANPHRHLVNLATAASLAVHLPELSTHCHVGAADGLLILFRRDTKVVRLRDPLSNAVTEFPSLNSIVAAVPPSRPEYRPAVFRNPGGVVSNDVNGAGFDDSTFPPTLVLCLRGASGNIVFAKPGDAHWTLVSPGHASNRKHNLTGKVPFSSLLSLGGRCYVASPEGSVYLVELRPLPRLVLLVDQRRFVQPSSYGSPCVFSFLVGGSGGMGMVMVRLWTRVNLLASMAPYSEEEVFTLRGMTNRIEVLKVDITRGVLVPMRNLGRRAVFVGLTHCVLISTETFPSVLPDAVYLGCLTQQSLDMGIYHIKHKSNHMRIEPRHKFIRYEGILTPIASPCNLDYYLVCYVDRKHSFGGACINHARHIEF
ncbi:hypothetical protein ACP70R_034990 [Stipagrostis hirtigluma subsp. patula]